MSVSAKLGNSIVEALEQAKEILVREGETKFTELRPRDKREIYEVVTKTIGIRNFEADGDKLGSSLICNFGDECHIVFFARGSYDYDVRDQLSDFTVDIDYGENTVEAIDAVIPEVRREIAESLPLALLNTSIITADGTFTLRTISLDDAKDLIADHESLDSAIGHESTAQIMTELLGVDVPVNRQMFEQQPGQKALVFKLNGRPPEGKILTAKEIDEIGYTLKVMERK